MNGYDKLSNEIGKSETDKKDVENSKKRRFLAGSGSNCQIEKQRKSENINEAANRSQNSAE